MKHWLLSAKNKHFNCCTLAVFKAGKFCLAMLLKVSLKKGKSLIGYTSFIKSHY